MRRSFAEPKNLRASAAIIRQFLSVHAVTAATARRRGPRAAQSRGGAAPGRREARARARAAESMIQIHGKTAFSRLFANGGTSSRGRLGHKRALNPCQLRACRSGRGNRHFAAEPAIANAQRLGECPPLSEHPSDLAPGKPAVTSLPLAARLASVHAASRAWLYGAAAAVALQFAVAMPVRAATDDPVVARVNGTEIHASDLAIAEEDVGSNLPMTGDARREYLTKYLADMILVAQAAEAKKLQDRNDFKQRLAYSREKLLMEMMLQQEGKASISEAALRQLYQEAVKQMAGEKEVHARHILVESEDQAKAVLAELKKGADFASLAKEKSKDPGAGNGGDLGFFTKDQMVPEFAQAAFKLEPGQLSDPVKTQFGWHVIKVEEKRDRPIPEFDKVRDQLESFLARRTQADLINKLRAQAKIERVDAAPEPAPIPAPGAPKQK